MKSKLSFLLLGCLMLGTQAFAAESISSSRVIANIQSFQTLDFPDIDIGVIDPSDTTLLGGYSVKDGSTVTAQSNGGNGYIVTVTQDIGSVGDLFKLYETGGGTDIMEIYLYENANLTPGTYLGTPPEVGQLTFGDTVLNFSEQTLDKKFVSIQPVIPGAQFTNISQGEYVGTITMTLTDN